MLNKRTVQPNWDIIYDENDTPEEREAWRQEVERDRRVFNDPEVKKQLGEIIMHIISDKSKKRSIEDRIDEWQKWADENKTVENDE